MKLVYSHFIRVNIFLCSVEVYFIFLRFHRRRWEKSQFFADIIGIIKVIAWISIRRGAGVGAAAETGIFAWEFPCVESKGKKNHAFEFFSRDFFWGSDVICLTAHGFLSSSFWKCDGKCYRRVGHARGQGGCPCRNLGMAAELFFFFTVLAE